jgi:hypothetical protein
MSKEFGFNKRIVEKNGPTRKEIEKMYPNPLNLKNDRYSQLIMDYFKCATHFLNEKDMPQMLEKQLNRLDLDTVCAYELYQMKKEFTTTGVLDLSNFVQKH